MAETSHQREKFTVDAIKKIKASLNKVICHIIDPGYNNTDSDPDSSDYEKHTDDSDDSDSSET